MLVRAFTVTQKNACLGVPWQTGQDTIYLETTRATQKAHCLIHESTTKHLSFPFDLSVSIVDLSESRRTSKLAKLDQETKKCFEYQKVANQLPNDDSGSHLQVSLVCLLWVHMDANACYIDLGNGEHQLAERLHFAAANCIADAD